MKHIIKN